MSYVDAHDGLTDDQYDYADWQRHNRKQFDRLDTDAQDALKFLARILAAVESGESGAEHRADGFQSAYQVGAFLAGSRGVIRAFGLDQDDPQ